MLGRAASASPCEASRERFGAEYRCENVRVLDKVILQSNVRDNLLNVSAQTNVEILRNSEKCHISGISAENVSSHESWEHTFRYNIEVS